MRSFFKFGAAVLGLALTTSAVRAGGDIPFSYTGVGGNIPDGNFSAFSLDLPAEIQNVLSLELVINDLSHTHPDDLKIFLIHPFQGVISILQDQGDGLDLSNVTVTFRDDAAAAAPDEGQILAQAYRPLGLANGTDGGLGQFVGVAGAGMWNLLVIDDSAGDTGSFRSFTLNGTYVPEPMTLSLLAFGALAAIRRRTR